jgi:hypothetical protein
VRLLEYAPYTLALIVSSSQENPLDRVPSERSTEGAELLDPVTL